MNLTCRVSKLEKVMSSEVLSNARRIQDLSVLSAAELQTLERLTDKISTQGQGALDLSRLTDTELHILDQLTAKIEHIGREDVKR